MAYHSSVYLLLFLPLVWALWALAPQKYRAGVLLGGSLWFYWCGANYGIVWLLGIAAVVWLLGLAMGRAEELCAAVRPALDPPARKALKKQAAALKRCLLVPGVAGLVLSYYLNTSAGAAVVLCCAAVYFVTLPLRRRITRPGSISKVVRVPSMPVSSVS